MSTTEIRGSTDPSDPTDWEPPAGAHVVTLPLLVSLIDVDAVQINFTRYYQWKARSYEIVLAELGHPVGDLLAEGFAQPVVAAYGDFRKPIGLGGRITQRTWIHRVGRTSFEFRDEFRDEDGDLLAALRSTHVWITLHPQQAAAPVPDWLRAAAGT